MRQLIQIFSASFVVFLALALSYHFVYAEDPTPTPSTGASTTPTPDNSAKIDELSKKIAELETKLSQTQSQERTLSSEIKTMDNNITLTEYRITATQNEVSTLEEDIGTATDKIENLETALSGITKVLLNRVVATYQAGTIPSIKMLVSADDFSDYLSRENYLKIVQAHDKKLIYDTQQAKNDYENQKSIFEEKKKKVEALNDQLEQYKVQLDQEKVAKERLLRETQGNEANYQRILAETRAQLAGFHGFVTSQGGASILSNQTVCDDWGCYYNQRDAQWGNNPLNGTGYTLASDGCLVTSMAMIYTHYGHRDINPQSINSNSSNFGGIPPALLRFSISANGISSQRISSDIDSTLASGHPVVIGISYDGGNLADHFLVLVSGSGGNYIMNDPFTPNGHNISFRGRYPTVRIVQYYKVTF